MTKLKFHKKYEAFPGSLAMDKDELLKENKNFNVDTNLCFVLANYRFIIPIGLVTFCKINIAHKGYFVA